jgi:hypothetical protein
MKFAKRIDRFGEGVFSKLAEIKKRKLPPAFCNSQEQER